MFRSICIASCLLLSLGCCLAQHVSAAAQPKIDAVFVLDTTGSMGGMIAGAKEKVWSIARMMVTAQPAPNIRMGLVAYRDHGDVYVTKLTPLSSNIDSVYQALMAMVADGGGDTPESVNQALNDAVVKMAWDTDPHTYRVIFLVGDAPPHMNYKDDVKYPVTCAMAAKRGININTILCGGAEDAKKIWKEIATLANSDTFQVAESGGTVSTPDTPYDGILAALSMDLDGTRLYYGTDTERTAGAKRLDTARTVDATTPKRTLADRAGFLAKTINNSEAGIHDLIADILAGRVALKNVDPGLLPAPLHDMTPEERERYVARVLAIRKEVQQALVGYSAKRQAELLEQIKKTGKGTPPAMDFVIFMAVKDQASKKGIVYEVHR